MPEESKEEYLAQHRKQLTGEQSEEKEVDLEEEKLSFSTRLKKWFLLLLLAVFVWFLYQIFGMMKSN